MTFNTKDLRDGHLPLVERIDVALRRVTNGEGQMRVPVEATDPDIVLHNCRDRIIELEELLREHEGVTRDAVAATLAGNALAGELVEANVEVERLKPYALAKIAEFRLASARAELEGAEDAQEHRAVSSEIADWENARNRLQKLAREQWEIRDTKNLVWVKLADMAEAAAR